MGEWCILKETLDNAALEDYKIDVFRCFCFFRIGTSSLERRFIHELVNEYKIEPSICHLSRANLKRNSG